MTASYSAKIRIADDAPPIRELLRLGLSSQRFKVFEAANVKTALEPARNRLSAG